jgi:hypothetical protein
MVKRRAAYIAWFLAVPALLPAVDKADVAATANTAKPADSAADTPADADLLEYLGSVDAEEGQDWMDYLARTDIAQVAKAKKPAPTTVDEEP